MRRRTCALTPRSSSTDSMASSHSRNDKSLFDGATLSSNMAADAEDKRLRETWRSICAPRRRRPAIADFASRPTSTTCSPAAAAACAMPSPMTPRPMTPTRRTPALAIARSAPAIGPGSAVEVYDIVNPRPLDAGVVRLHARIFVAKGNAEQQPMIGVEAEMLAHDLGIEAERALGAGRHAACGHRQHQGLGVDADVGGLASVERMGHENEHDMWRVEKPLVAHVSELPPNDVPSLHAHGSVELHRGIDLPLAVDSDEFGFRWPIRLWGHI